jgi:Winged helix-turn-helix DNA-binding
VLVAVLSRQSLRAPETFDAWLDAARRAVAALPDGDLPACPYCGRFDLQVRFVADPQTRIGYAAVWSDFCLRGIHISRVEVPNGAPFVVLDAPAGVLAAHIPSFTEIGPSGSVPSGRRDESRSPEAAVLRLLTRRGPMTVSQIAAELAISEGVVAAHIERLTRDKAVALAGDREAPTGIEPVYTALQAAA